MPSPTFTVKTSGFDTTNASVYNTAAVVLDADKLYYLVFGASRTPPDTASTVQHDPTGTPLSFSNVQTVVQANGTDDNGIQVWKVVPVSTTASAAVRVTLPNGHSQGLWVLVEVTDFDPTGTEVQIKIATGSGTTATVTMDAYGAVDNAIFSCITLAEFSNGTTITEEHTQLAEIDDTERQEMTTQYQSPHASDLTPSGTWTGTQGWAIIGIEVKAAAGGGAAIPDLIVAPIVAAERAGGRV